MRMMVRKKGGDRNQEFPPIYSFPLPILILLDSNKDVWMDLDQVYNFIQIVQNKPKRTQGSQIVPNTHTSFPIF